MKDLADKELERMFLIFAWLSLFSCYILMVDGQQDVLIIIYKSLALNYQDININFRIGIQRTKIKLWLLPIGGLYILSFAATL